MQAKLRKYRNHLATSGLGVIAFAIWTIVKVFLYSVLPSENAGETLFTDGFDDNVLVIAIIILLALVVIDIGIRVFVGLSARAHARGKKKSLLYVIVTILLLVSSLINTYFMFTNISEYTIIGVIANLLFELSSVLVMLMLVISSLKVRSIEKKLKAGAEHAD